MPSFAYKNDRTIMNIICEAQCGPCTGSMCKKGVLVAIDLMFNCGEFRHPECILLFRNDPIAMNPIRRGPKLAVMLILMILG